MTKDFSDAPLTVEGVTVKPTWPWSKQYRAEVAENMRLQGYSHIPPDEVACRYVEWYANKYGLTHKEVRKRLRL